MTNFSPFTVLHIPELESYLRNSAALPLPRRTSCQAADTRLRLPPAGLFPRQICKVIPRPFPSIFLSTELVCWPGFFQTPRGM